MTEPWFSQSERELGYHILRNFPYPNAAVCAAVVQVGGELAGVVVCSSQGRSHDPKTASELFHEVGIITREPRISFQKPGTIFHADR